MVGGDSGVSGVVFNTDEPFICADSADELNMCSPEVRAVFDKLGGSFFVGTPTMMELAFQLRKLNESIAEAGGLSALVDAIRDKGGS